MTTLLAPGYSSITIYLDDELFRQLLAGGHKLKTTVSLGEVCVQPRTYVHVHNHSNGHVKAYIEGLTHLENRQTEIDLSFVMNLTV